MSPPAWYESAPLGLNSLVIVIAWLAIVAAICLFIVWSISASHHPLTPNSWFQLTVMCYLLSITLQIHVLQSQPHPEPEAPHA